MDFKVIIDTDAGSDDAVAIFLALAVQTIRILAITCTYGNTDESNVEINVRKILTIANRTDIPIYGGATKPFVQPYTSFTDFSRDGMGDVLFDKRIIVNVDKSKDAAQAMVDLVNEYPDEVNILTLGPLTNVARASQLDDKFTRNVKKFYIMGSNSTYLHRKKSEFNFRLDPESNEILLKSYTKRKIQVLPCDIPDKYSIPKIWRCEVFGKLDSEIIKWLNKFESPFLDKFDAWYAADPITAATMIWPNLVKEKKQARMDAIVTPPRRGDVLINCNCEDELKNVEIVKDINIEEFKEILMRYLGNQKPSNISKGNFSTATLNR